MRRPWSSAWILAVVTVSCRRIGYDERSDDDTDATETIDSAPPIDAEPIDAIDALAACPSGTAELCAGHGHARSHSACVHRRRPTAALLEHLHEGGGSTLEWEWTADESGIADKRGYDSCDSQSTHPIVDAYDFRCCADR